MRSFTIPRILYEDNHLIVLSKPAGLLSQGDASGDSSLVDWLRDYFGRHYVGLVHRLDRNTSGIMIVAKRSKAADRLTNALQEGLLERRYKAWVLGKFPRPCETWRHYLLKNEEKNESRVARRGTPGAKEAQLSLQVLSASKFSGREISLVEIKLETGRSHQIRVQAAAERHPILGDPKYGEYAWEEWNRSFGRPALHSFLLSFPHPMSGEKMTFEDALPSDMSRLLPPCRPEAKV